MTVIITMIKVLIIMIITSFLQIINNKGKRAREKEEGRRGKRREIKLIYEWQLNEILMVQEKCYIDITKTNNDNIRQHEKKW